MNLEMNTKNTFLGEYFLLKFNYHGLLRLGPGFGPGFDPGTSEFASIKLTRSKSASYEIDLHDGKP